MDKLTGIKVFRTIVAAGSFVEAAKRLSMTTAWASKLMAQLEAELGVQLLTRTTRKLSLTDAGKIYLERVSKTLDELEEIEQTLSTRKTSAIGKLRVSAPMSFGITTLSPQLSKFLKKYPLVELDLVLSDNIYDLVDKEFDVAIRIKPKLDDSSLIVRKISQGKRILCASRAYLKEKGTPQDPQELMKHACLRYSLHSNPSKWEFEKKGKSISVNVQGPMMVNNSLVLKEAAMAGSGVLLAPEFVIRKELNKGQLIQLMSDWTPSGYNVYAVYPPGKYRSEKINAFIEFVSETLATST